LRIVREYALARLAETAQQDNVRHRAGGDVAVRLSFTCQAGTATRPRKPHMAKYLCIVTYTAEGLKGLMAKGGTARVEAARKFLASAGGSLDSYYFALGADDAYIVCDLPDNVAAAATAMSAAATGMVVNRMVALLTADDVDRAAVARLSYDAPGS
jgi:uncharacterized protein with GYD domain